MSIVSSCKRDIAHLWEKLNFKLYAVLLQTGTLCFLLFYIMLMLGLFLQDLHDGEWYMFMFTRQWHQNMTLLCDLRYGESERMYGVQGDMSFLNASLTLIECWTNLHFFPSLFLPQPNVADFNIEWELVVLIKYKISCIFKPYGRKWRL